MPFLRPESLAGDRVPISPCSSTHSPGCTDEGYVPDLVVQLRPTSPLRPDGLVDEGIAPAARRRRGRLAPGGDGTEQNPFKMWRIEEGVLVPLVDSGIAEQYNRPRQELPVTYWQIGTLDVIRTSTIVEHTSMSGRRILPTGGRAELAADIDDADRSGRRRRRAAEVGARGVAVKGRGRGHGCRRPAPPGDPRLARDHRPRGGERTPPPAPRSSSPGPPSPRCTRSTTRLAAAPRCRHRGEPHVAARGGDRAGRARGHPRALREAPRGRRRRSRPPWPPWRRHAA